MEFEHHAYTTLAHTRYTSCPASVFKAVPDSDGGESGSGMLAMPLLPSEVAQRPTVHHFRANRHMSSSDCCPGILRDAWQVGVSKLATDELIYTTGPSDHQSCCQAYCLLWLPGGESGFASLATTRRFPTLEAVGDHGRLKKGHVSMLPVQYVTKVAYEFLWCNLGNWLRARHRNPHKVPSRDPLVLGAYPDCSGYAFCNKIVSHVLESITTMCRADMSTWSGTLVPECRMSGHR